MVTCVPMSPLPLMARWVSTALPNTSARTAKCISSRRSAGGRERHCSERAGTLFCPTHLLQRKCAAGWQRLNRLHLTRMSLPSPRSGTPAPLAGCCLSHRGLSSTGLPGKVALAPARGAQERPRRVRARPALGSLPWHDAPEMIVCTVDCQKILRCAIQHTRFFFFMRYANYKPLTRLECQNFLQPAHVMAGMHPPKLA